MKDNVETIPEWLRDERIREALGRVIKLYESWERTDKAAEWRAEMATSQLTHPTESSSPVAGD